MTHRNNGDDQAVASAKAGLSERTARRIEAGELTPEAAKQRHWPKNCEELEELDRRTGQPSFGSPRKPETARALSRPSRGPLGD